MDRVPVPNAGATLTFDIFFIKDQVDSKCVKIEDCPTGDMLADFFTKPWQGMQFQKLSDQMMNIDPSSAYHSSSLGHRSVLKTKLPLARLVWKNVVQASGESWSVK
jgi:hypothetical protein